MKTLGAGLIEHAHGRSKTIVVKMRNTMSVIEAEIEKNEGIYAYNGGRLSEAEFCRRAKFNQVTLLRKPHRETTKVELAKWLQAINAKLVTGKKVVRKAVTERVDKWMERYQSVATEFHLFKIQSIAKDESIAQLKTRVSELEQETLQLQQALSKGVVVTMPRKRK